ncbi:hypothetical protein D3C76_1225770 [compost metagenome]
MVCGSGRNSTDELTEAVIGPVDRQHDPQALSGLALAYLQIFPFNVIPAHGQHVRRPLPSQIGQVHCILQFRRSLAIHSSPHLIIGVIVARLLLVLAHALARVLLVSQTPFPSSVKYV